MPGPETPPPMPLEGLRVLELGQLIAGPFACAMLASFGAEVIKLEPPGLGDPLRRWRKLYQGTSLWWRVMGRNKRSVTVDLRDPRGQALVKRMVARGEIDILVENFRPGRMERWGLGWDALHALDPRLIMVRVSGWGQDGPRAREPGFANVAEAAAGLRYLTGEPGRAPVRSGVSIGDSLAGLHAAYGALAAVHHRDARGTGEGQLVDVALSESIFNMMESLLPEYDVFGHVRRRSGAKLEGIAPTGTYRCAASAPEQAGHTPPSGGGDGEPDGEGDGEYDDGHDDEYIVIGANSDAMFIRLMDAIGRPDLARDPRFAHNDGRVRGEAEIDAAIARWARARSRTDALHTLRAAEVACGSIHSIADIARDPQFVARGSFEEVALPGDPDGRAVKIPAPVPKLGQTPGQTRWLGPELGQDTHEVLRRLAGLDGDELAALADAGVI